MVFNLIFWVGLIVGRILLVIWAARRLQPETGTRRPTASEILDARFARGGITRQQYQDVKQDMA